MSRGGGRKSEFTTEEPVAKVTFSGRITGKSLPVLVTMPHCQQAAGSTGQLLCPYPTPHRAANQRAGAGLVGHAVGAVQPSVQGWWRQRRNGGGQRPLFWPSQATIRRRHGARPDVLMPTGQRQTEQTCAERHHLLKDMGLGLIPTRWRLIRVSARTSTGRQDGPSPRCSCCAGEGPKPQEIRGYHAIQ